MELLKKKNRWSQWKQDSPIRFKQDDAIISFDSVTLRYHETSVFEDVSFRLKKGDMRFLTGESGAGKSSLLRLMYLGNDQYTGTIKLFGQNPRTLTSSQKPLFRQKIGVVFQDFNLLDHLTTLDNVTLPLRIAGFPEKQCRSRAIKILQWVGLNDHIESYPKTLSGGQQQRVVIARAVIAKPDILLADEPTGNVDDKNAVRLIELFEGMNKMGTTVIIATHNRDLVKEFNYPEMCLADGSLYFRGANDDYVSSYAEAVGE